MSTRQPARMTKPGDPIAPLYQQIRHSVRNSIIAGTHCAGDRLPSESDPAQTFGTTRTTVRLALSQLVFEGLIVRHNGRGSFVSDKPVIRSAIDSRHCLTFEEQVPVHRFVADIIGARVPTIVVSITAEIASDEVAVKLGVPPGSALIVRANTHHAQDGAPVLCGRSIFPGDVCTDYVLGQSLPTSRPTPGPDRPSPRQD